MSEGLITVNLVTEHKEGDEMSAKPVPRSAPLFDRTMVTRAVLMVSSMVAAILGWLIWRSSTGANLAQLQTETFTMVVLCAWFNALNCRFERSSSLFASFASNPWLSLGVVLGAIAHTCVIYFRPLGSVFGTVAIELRTALAMLAVASCVLLTEELRKVYARAGHQKACADSVP